MYFRIGIAEYVHTTLDPGTPPSKKQEIPGNARDPCSLVKEVSEDGHHGGVANNH